MNKLPLLALLIVTASPLPALAATSGVDQSYVDKSVKPGDNFDAYANGAWRARTEIPADRSSTGVGYEVFLKAEKRNAEIIQGAAKASPAAGTDQRRIADYYAAYLDQAAIDARGLAPVQPLFARIEAAKDRSDLSRLIGSSVRADTDPLNATNFWTENLFGVFVTQSLNDPAKTVPYILQGGTGLPDRDYFLSASPEMAKIRDAYRVYIGDMLQLAGLPNAKARGDAIYALEMKIAQAQAGLVESQDIHKANNPWTRADFAAKAPGIDWAAFLDAAHLGGQQDFIVWQPDAVAGLSKLVASEPLDVWKDWLRFHIVSQYAQYLPKALDDRRFAFYGQTLSGTPKQRDRWKRAISNVNADLGDAVGKLYAERYFPPAAKADVQAMVQNILAAFDKRVAALGWMAPATKAEARRKIESLIVGVGYPESWRSYAELPIRADDPFGNAWRAREAEYRHQLAKIGQPIDRREWWMTPQTVNAINLPLQNALNFPAAILEAPYYDPKADAAANYGAIGAIIGHEISHSFDNLGSEFDSTGRLRNWWTAEDLAHFKEQGAALVKQYDGYEVLPGLHVNGEQTLGENIADVAGLAAALDAYHASLKGKPAPVIDGLTGDQRFFLAFAQAWRSKARDASIRQQVATDVHAPARQRAQTVRNLDAWYPAFDVKPGQRLYLDAEGRVKVW